MPKEVNKLSDRQIRGWVSAGTPLAKADGDGLTFTLSAAGTAAWVLRYRHGGKGRELTLGQYPDVSLKLARQRAGDARAEVQAGVDVARERQRKKTESAAAKSFRQLAADYMTKVFPTLAASTVKQRRQHIEGVICPKLGNRPARTVTTADVVSLIESVGRTKTGNVAELVFTALSEIFKHGLARHAVIVNPCAGVSVAAICGKTEPRRLRLKLTEAELRAVLPALPTIGTDNALAVKLLLLTCTRIGELAKTEWAHVDFARAEWFVPDANSKTGKGFTVPLTPAALAGFTALQPLACGSRFVLPARQTRRTRNHGGAEVPFEQRTLNAMLHKLCDALGEKVRRFTPHDLRSRVEPSGWISALASAEAELIRVQQMQQDYRHDKAVSNTLRIEHAEATAHRDHLAAEVACCQRLVHDARMQPAYARLVNLPNVTDAHLSGFIHAAWAAMIDYTKYRDRVTEAAELAGKVADAADVLAGLLRRAESSGGHGHFPTEFFSLPSLMEKTEHAPDDRDFHILPGMRDYILGESEPAQAEPSKPREPPEVVQIKVVLVTKAEPLDPDEGRRGMLRYAWNTAPTVGRIVATLHRAALTCAPAESGFIGVAIASRKRNREKEYLRAFAALLRDEHKIELTINTMNAMATTATVVLNDPDLDATYDDVRKALATIAS